MRLKAAVNGGATEIAEEYLNEIAPYIGDVDLPRLFGLLPRHIMTREQVGAAREEYDAVTEAAGGQVDGDVLALLYRAGLLGCIQRDLVSGAQVQRFLMPGDEALDRSRELPESTHYLVHPILAAIVVRHNPEYARDIDTLNVVGAARPWREPGADDGDERARALRAAGRRQGLQRPHAGGGRRPGGVGRAARRRDGARGALPLVGGDATGDALLVVHDDPERAGQRGVAAERGSLRGARPAAAPRGAGSRSRCASTSPATARSWCWAASRCAAWRASSRTWRPARSGAPTSSARCSRRGRRAIRRCRSRRRTAASTAPST